jgi:hypothetical protein
MIPNQRLKMPHKFQIYPDPLDAHCTLRTDDGFTGNGVGNTDANGRPGQIINVIDGHPSGHGAEITLTHPSYETLSMRGFLVIEEDVARLQVDDYRMTLTPTTPTPPTTPPPTSGPDPNANPLDIINYVFNSTHPNLSTAAGCGLFAEDCCKELHEKMHPAWGHIRKNPGQNQFNGHAVDAVMLVVPSGQTAPGIYDIIQSSASPEAKPVFNYVEPPVVDLWYYPAAPIQSGVDLRTITVWHPRPHSHKK